jgi:RNA polymerase sigma-70 factor, ECF subfamily
MDLPDGTSWTGSLRGSIGAGQLDARVVDPWPMHGSRSIEPDHRDERRIVQTVLAGDRDAYRLLVERESPAVIRACHRILGDLEDAEDAAQEAFVIAYRSLTAWRAEGPLGAWLTRIAVRIALRQAARRRTVEWLDPVGHREGSIDRVGQAIATASVARAGESDPASLAVRAERATSVRAAVAALGEPYREVVALRFFGELSLDEIATQTGRPLGTVKTHLHRGLLRLRGAMGEDAAR